MPELIGDPDPDPHYMLQVAAGQYSCAVPACTEHKYPSIDIVVPAVFLGGEYPGTGTVVNPDPSIMRNGTEYVLGAYEKAAVGPGAVYYPAEEMP